MFEALENNGFVDDLTMESSYKEIQKAYFAMLAEFEDEVDVMYPNGRDYDAENFD